MPRRCRHRSCPDWLIKNSNLLEILFNEVRDNKSENTKLKKVRDDLEARYKREIAEKSLLQKA